MLVGASLCVIGFGASKSSAKAKIPKFSPK